MPSLRIGGAVTVLPFYALMTCARTYLNFYNPLYIYHSTNTHLHHHKHQGLDPLIRSVSRIWSKGPILDVYKYCSRKMKICSKLIFSKQGKVSWLKVYIASIVAYWKQYGCLIAWLSGFFTTDALSLTSAVWPTPLRKCTIRELRS
jgi:hypothetical protein